VFTSFEVSVVIPVYNAAAYVRKAVESAVFEPEVKEVVLVDDGYPDDALVVCSALADRFEKVKLFRHPNGENRGVGASRNLGITMANADHIAFLDADDYYLPGRFKAAAKLFLSNPEVDAVYEPVGTAYTSNRAKEIFCDWRGISLEEADNHLSYPSVPTSGRAFFYSLLEGGKGYPHTNGITLKKGLFDKAGLFNEQLKLHQDAELWIRMAYYGTFMPGGHRNPVAIRVAHMENRISGRNYQSMYSLNKTVYNWSKSLHLDKRASRAILRNYFASKYLAQLGKNSLWVKVAWRLRYYLARLAHTKYW